MERTIALLAAILLLRFATSEAQYQRAKRNGRKLVFPPGVGLRLILGLGGPFVAYVTYRVAVQARETGEWWLPVLTGFIAMGSLLFRPPTIQIDESGISATGLLGRKQVVWEGTSASFVPGLREVLVIGRDGTTIKHSGFHVGQEEFLFQLERHNVFIQR